LDLKTGIRNIWLDFEGGKIQHRLWMRWIKEILNEKP